VDSNDLRDSSPHRGCHDHETVKVQVFGSNRRIPVKNDAHGRLETVAQTLGQGVDGVLRTTQQDIHGTTSTIPNASAYAQAGLLFGISQEDLISPGDQEFTVAFNNPGPRVMYLNTVSGGVQLEPALQRGYHETLHVTVSSGNVTGGAEVFSVNYNVGSPITSTVLVTLNPVIQSEVRLSVTRHPTGEFWLNFNGQIVVPPGFTLIVRIEGNLGEGVDNISYTVTWYELDT
jgi:hypothetical protein